MVHLILLVEIPIEIISDLSNIFVTIIVEKMFKEADENLFTVLFSFSMYLFITSCYLSKQGEFSSNNTLFQCLHHDKHVV